MLTDKLIQKYNVPVPRYTSYPPANHFNEDFTTANYLEAVKESNQTNPEHISFYIHIPFCKHLCHYCGCNSFPLMKPEVVNRYIKALFKEIEMIKPLLDPSRKIAQIHYGGGTPTILPVQTLKEINDYLLDGFDTIENPEIAIECHPGYLDESYWRELTEAHFNRFSIGVQDFNDQVLKTANRRPSLMPIEEVVAILREKKARINMDFIYGLPHQTVESFNATIEKAIKLQPDRLVTFSYAHVPWVSKRQVILEKAGLPDDNLKKEIFEQASLLLKQAGYQTIGLDHFVREDDELYQALHAKQLHRNFQGYCTRRTTGQVYAFGVTGIGQLNSAYTQNNKDIEIYMSQIESGELPIARGYQLTKEQQITRSVIETLMCNYAIHWDELSKRLGCTKQEIMSAIRYKEDELKEFEKDGLLLLDDNNLEMTKEGKLFVRNVAASFDPLMVNTTKQFSKPV